VKTTLRYIKPTDDDVRGAMVRWGLFEILRKSRYNIVKITNQEVEIDLPYANGHGNVTMGDRCP
jgi:hypothetical protein